MTPWLDVARVAGILCRDDMELRSIQELWEQDEEEQRKVVDRFGAGIQQLRKKQGTSRRELADLFGIGGKKPARIIKYIEEDGFYSAQAYPAGLVAILTDVQAQRERLLGYWRERRRQFHRRHRPET